MHKALHIHIYKNKVIYVEIGCAMWNSIVRKSKCEPAEVFQSHTTIASVTY